MRIDRDAVDAGLVDDGVQDLTRHRDPRGLVDDLDPVHAIPGQFVHGLARQRRRVELDHARFLTVRVRPADRAGRVSPGRGQDQSDGKEPRPAQRSSRDARPYLREGRPEVAGVVDGRRARSEERLQPPGKPLFDVPHERLVAVDAAGWNQVNVRVDQSGQNGVAGAGQVDHDIGLRGHSRGRDFPYPAVGDDDGCVFQDRACAGDDAGVGDDEVGPWRDLRSAACAREHAERDGGTEVVMIHDAPVYGGLCHEGPREVRFRASSLGRLSGPVALHGGARLHQGVEGFGASPPTSGL